METKEVEEALLRIQEEFSWPVRADRFEVLDTGLRNRSHAHLMRVAGVGASLDLVVKRDPSWSTEDPRRIFAAMKQLGEIFGSNMMRGASFVDPLGWSTSPPIVVMPYIEAEEMGVVIRRPVDPEVTTKYLRRVGAMMAAYHQSHRVADDEDRQRAVDDTVQVARFLPGGDRRVRRALDRIQNPSVYVFGDATLGNVLFTTSGDLVLIDPPLAPIPGIVHRDMAGLIFDMRKKLAGVTATRRPRIQGFTAMRTAILEGYFGPSLRSEDVALIALYEFRAAAGTAGKRLSARSSASAWFAWDALESAIRFMRHA